jgi:hypothetical protein
MRFATEAHPAPYATLLAAALTRVGPIAFPTTDVAAVDVESSLARCARWAPKRAARKVRERGRLCLTHAPAAVAELFDTEGFSWTLQAQFALLCDQSAIVEDLAVLDGVLERIVEREWGEVLQRLQSLGVTGILRPGTDGDLAGALFADHRGRTRFLEALEEAAHAARTAFAVVDEDGFAAALAG